MLSDQWRMVASGAVRRHFEVLPAERAGHQKDNDAHSLLSVIAAVTQAKPSRRYQLTPAKDSVHSPGGVLMKKPSHRPGNEQADGHANERGQENEQDRLADSGHE